MNSTTKKLHFLQKSSLRPRILHESAMLGLTLRTNGMILVWGACYKMKAVDYYDMLFDRDKLFRSLGQNQQDFCISFLRISDITRH